MSCVWIATGLVALVTAISRLPLSPSMLPKDLPMTSLERATGWSSVALGGRAKGLAALGRDTEAEGGGGARAGARQGGAPSLPPATTAPARAAYSLVTRLERAASDGAMLSE